MGSKRLTPTVVGKMASKMLLVVCLVVCRPNFNKFLVMLIGYLGETQLGAQSILFQVYVLLLHVSI